MLLPTHSLIIALLILGIALLCCVRYSVGMANTTAAKKAMRVSAQGSGCLICVGCGRCGLL